MVRLCLLYPVKTPFNSRISRLRFLYLKRPVSEHFLLIRHMPAGHSAF
jgi:hypothetical protein